MIAYDIVIVGGGPVGLGFACLVGGLGLKIAVIEKSVEALLANPAPDGRDITLTHHSIQVLENIGAWRNIVGTDIAPIKRVRVKNADSSYLLSFDHERTKHAALGYLVSNHIIRRVLYQAAKERENVDLLAGTDASDLDLGEPLAKISLSSGDVLEAALVVAADSRFSKMRREAGIGAKIRDFSHVAIVCRMKHEKPHDGTAYEWFDAGQTLAVLPLNNREFSIVITLPESAAPRVMGLAPNEFAAEVEQRLAGQWGRMELSSKRYTYPLVAVYADRFSAHRFALIGDAAVGMHPVTAHGFNFGLKGINNLAAKVRAAFRAGRDIGSISVLESYDREHRRATYPLYVATNALVGLYTDDQVLARIARNALLRLGNALPPVKDWLLYKLTETDERRTGLKSMDFSCGVPGRPTGGAA